MVTGVWSDDANLRLEATTQFRKLLSIGLICSLFFSIFGICLQMCLEYSHFFCFIIERNPPIQEVILSGVVPRFIEFLSGDEFPQLQV